MLPTQTSGSGSGPSRRAVVASGAIAGIGAAVGVGTASAHAAPPSSPAARPAADEAILRSTALEVRVATGFPRVVSYTDRKSRAVLHGQPDPVGTLLIDDKEHTPKVTATVRGDRAAYTLTLDGGTRIDVEIAVEGHQVHWRVTKIADTAALRVGTLRVPGLALLSVRSDQPGAALLAAKVQLDKAKSGDTLVKLTPDTPADAASGCAYAVLAHDKLGGAVETNTVYDKPTAETNWENGRLWRQTVRKDAHVEARLTPGQWTHRAATSPAGATEPLPYATVVITGDRNGDGKVDWQDAAIAFRDIMVNPLGADEQHLRVVPHIPFNFASQATNPFLATLDDGRVAIAALAVGCIQACLDMSVQYAGERTTFGVPIGSTQGVAAFEYTTFDVPSGVVRWPGQAASPVEDGSGGTLTLTFFGNVEPEAGAAQPALDCGVIPRWGC